MLFESLDKLRRNSIFSSIILIALGAVILICPEAYVSALTLILGYALVILSLVMMLDFIPSRKSLMDYLKFSGALVLLIVGLSVLVFRTDVVRALAWLFGFFLILDGGRTLFHSFTYARRSQRKGWWILTVLSILLMVAGVVLVANPRWRTPASLTKVIGCAVLFSALVSALRLIWTWPLRNIKGGNEDVR